MIDTDIASHWKARVSKLTNEPFSRSTTSIPDPANWTELNPLRRNSANMGLEDFVASIEASVKDPQDMDSGCATTPADATPTSGHATTVEGDSGASAPTTTTDAAAGLEGHKIDMDQLKSYAIRKKVTEFPEYLIYYAFKEAGNILKKRQDEGVTLGYPDLGCFTVSMTDLNDMTTLPKIILEEPEEIVKSWNPQHLRDFWSEVYEKIRSWYLHDWEEKTIGPPDGPLIKDQNGFTFSFSLEVAYKGLEGHAKDYSIEGKSSNEESGTDDDQSDDHDSDNDVDNEEDDEDENEQYNKSEVSEAWSDSAAMEAAEDTWLGMLEFIERLMAAYRRRRPEAELIECVCKFVRAALLGADRTRMESAVKG